MAALRLPWTQCEWSSFFLWQGGRRKPVPCQRGLPIDRHDEEREARGGGRRVLHHGQSIVRSDGELRAQLDDLLARVLPLRNDRAGAIGQEDVGLALGDELAGDGATRGRRGRQREI